MEVEEPERKDASNFLMVPATVEHSFEPTVFTDPLMDGLKLVVIGQKSTGKTSLVDCLTRFKEYRKELSQSADLAKLEPECPFEIQKTSGVLDVETPRLLTVFDTKGMVEDDF